MLLFGSSVSVLPGKVLLGLLPEGDEDAPVAEALCIAAQILPSAVRFFLEAVLLRASVRLQGLIIAEFGNVQALRKACAEARIAVGDVEMADIVARKALFAAQPLFEPPDLGLFAAEQVNLPSAGVLFPELQTKWPS